MKNLATEVFIYPLDMAAYKPEQKIYAADGENLYEVINLRLVLKPNEDCTFDFEYQIQVHDKTIYVTSNSINLYFSPEDYKKGKPISKKSVSIDDILARTSIEFKKYFHTKISGNTIEIASYTLVPGGCDNVTRDVLQIEIDYMSCDYNNCKISGEFDTKNCIMKPEQAEYYQAFHVIAADGTETVESAPINHFKLSEDQKDLVDKFIALYEQMQREHIAFLFDFENSETYFINKSSKDDWVSSYEERKGYEQIDFDAVIDICPSYTLFTDWTNCDYNLMYKLPKSE